MKISTDWLRTYLADPDAPGLEPDDLDALLTRQSFPIEEHEVLEGGDALLDVEVTSNRPDCLSHIGLAREVAAGTGNAVKPPAVHLHTGNEKVTDLASVENRETGLCPIYTACVIRGVKVGPSPKWLVDRLAAIGQDSINNVADITNFVQMETGQPLHAFDLHKLNGSRIIVRRADAGETIDALNGDTYKLTPDHLVIADAKVPVAIAGVMGGEASKVTEDTVDVLLEVALFDRVSVRNTVNGLKVKVKNKLGTESSFRFERGVDPSNVEQVSARAAMMIVELAGGEIASGILKAGVAPPEPHKVTMRIARCNALLGLHVDADTIADYLDRLELSPKLAGDRACLTCTIPTFRMDLEREIDLIEEIARVHGFDAIEKQEKMPIITRPKQKKVAAREVIGDVLIAHGYHEAITPSFISPAHGDPFILEGHDRVLLEDERQKGEPMLRPSVVPSLLRCRKRNQDAGNHGIKLFETASVWNRKDGGVVEHQKLTLLCDAGEGDAALREMRGTIEELIARLQGDVAVNFTETTHACFAAAADVSMAGKSIGYFGLVDTKTQDAFDLQSRLIVADLDLPALLRHYPPARDITDLPKFPGIERDLSVVVEENTNWRTIDSAVRACEVDLLEAVDFITTWRGKQIGPGKKSVSFRLLFRDAEKTLRHDEVDPQIEKIVAKLKEELNAELRG